MPKYYSALYRRRHREPSIPQWIYDPWVTLPYSAIIAEAKKATLYVIYGEEHWIPHSQHERVLAKSIRVKRWLIKKKMPYLDLE